jgi:hypothetical protein
MKKLALILAVSAAATQANAAAWDLTTFNVFNNGQSADATLGGQLGFTTDVAHNIFSDGGVTSLATFVGITPLSTINITDWDITNAGVSSASAYECVEGIFGGIVQSSICGNYGFGTNNTDDSNLDYSSVASPVRNLLGDDIASGDMQSLANVSGLQAWFGSSEAGVWGTDFLAFTTRTIALDNSLSGNGNTVIFTSAVPVPAAAWLFGSALVGLAGVGRKRKMA